MPAGMFEPRRSCFRPCAGPRARSNHQCRLRPRQLRQPRSPLRLDQERVPADPVAATAGPDVASGARTNHQSGFQRNPGNRPRGRSGHTRRQRAHGVGSWRCDADTPHREHSTAGEPTGKCNRPIQRPQPVGRDRVARFSAPPVASDSPRCERLPAPATTKSQRARALREPGRPWLGGMGSCPSAGTHLRQASLALGAAPVLWKQRHPRSPHRPQLPTQRYKSPLVDPSGDP